MSVAKTEIRNRALRKLGVLGWGGTAITAVQTDMDQAYEEVYAQLEEENLTTWANDASVPNAYVPYVVNLCALARKSEHKVTPRRLQILDDEAGKKGELAWAGIRALKATTYQSTTEAEYY